jgi:D-methionine transport system permease protein
MFDSIIDNWVKFQDEIIQGLNETLYMLFVSFLISAVIGTIIGVLIALCGKKQVFENLWISTPLSWIVNIIRSIPFILLMIIMVPFSRLIIGTGYGIYASMISLSVIGTAVVSRLVEQAIVDINPHIYETAKSLGVTKFQIFFHFILVEARSPLILGYTSSLISLIAYSTVVGVINGGGLGFLAMEEGFYMWNQNIMWIIIVIMVILVQIIQVIGSLLARISDKKRKV